jgi:radical SAM superfamily enzyme YgiQ (UPF0313 family)
MRGCPFACYYCCSPKIYGPRASYRSVDNVISEVRFLVEKFGINSLYFFDPTFTLDRERSIELAERLKEFGLDWTCQTRVDQIDANLLRKLKLFSNVILA